ncbi:hypothetical protein C7U92_01335 [Bradyrhizobium sp. WBOS7]|nr:hypothetical protein [Bradyrhizobium sp. WBOS2]MDD1571872.1 hypothetical protein [Bradyrhizobium sp. WBOS1]MDD1575376.1 hypothetical protein [Bradyrhizobium sp. WBOS7]MDD1600839.1 hypothetical protein [Bradyrhizobium sp. WBOS16]
MAGLVPAIHVQPPATKGVDARGKPGHDEFVDVLFVPHRESPSPTRREREREVTGTATSCSSRCRPGPSPNCPCRPRPA